MCQNPSDADSGDNDTPQPSDNFPWQLGAYDAHCHPTDVMSSIDQFASMRASVLTIMATRSQDQELVAQVAASHGIASSKDLADTTGACRVVPAFGWHPWFSHQLYDDAAAEPTYKVDSDTSPADAKRAHYRAVLQPSPDDAFADGLPDPVPLSSFIAATRERLESHPLALVGEMGLDKAFRLPEHWDASDPTTTHDEILTPGSREGRRLRPQRVRMDHQQAIMAAQLKLAGEMGRAVSLHGVQAHGVLYDTVAKCWAGHELPSNREQKRVAPGAEDFSSSSEDEDEEEEGSLPARMKALELKKKQEKKGKGKPYPPRICLHSFSGSHSTFQQWMRRNIPARVYVSFSVAVNLSTEASRKNFNSMLANVPDDRVLVESDLHTAGAVMDGLLEHMYRRVCTAKGWSLEDGVARIRKNYETFIFG